MVSTPRLTGFRQDLVDRYARLHISTSDDWASDGEHRPRQSSSPPVTQYPLSQLKSYPGTGGQIPGSSRASPFSHINNMQAPLHAVQAHPRGIRTDPLGTMSMPSLHAATSASLADYIFNLYRSPTSRPASSIPSSPNHDHGQSPATSGTSPADGSSLSSPVLQHLTRDLLEWSVFPHDERVTQEVRSAIQASMRIKQRREVAAAAAEALSSPPGSPTSPTSRTLSRSSSLVNPNKPLDDLSRPRAIREEFQDVTVPLTGKHKWQEGLRSGSSPSLSRQSSCSLSRQGSLSRPDSAPTSPTRSHSCTSPSRMNSLVRSCSISSRSGSPRHLDRVSSSSSSRQFGWTDQDGPVLPAGVRVRVESHKAELQRWALGALESAEAQLGGELEQRVAALIDEKKQASDRSHAFASKVRRSIAQLEQVLQQLLSEEREMETTYDQCYSQLQEEYRQHVVQYKAGVEVEVRRKLHTFIAAIAQGGGREGVQQGQHPVG